MTRIGARLVLLLAIGATIGCDRVTRHVAATTLAGLGIVMLDTRRSDRRAPTS